MVSARGQAGKAFRQHAKSHRSAADVEATVIFDQVVKTETKDILLVTDLD